MSHTINVRSFARLVMYVTSAFAAKQVGAWESLAPGLTAHQLELREAGKAAFSLNPEVDRLSAEQQVEAAVQVELWQRVLLVSRHDDCRITS